MQKCNGDEVVEETGRWKESLALRQQARELIEQILDKLSINRNYTQNPPNRIPVGVREVETREGCPQGRVHATTVNPTKIDTTVNGRNCRGHDNPKAEPKRHDEVVDPSASGLDAHEDALRQSSGRSH